MNRDPVVETAIKNLAKENCRYREKAFLFIIKVIIYTNCEIRKGEKYGHVSAPLLLEGFRRLALQKFGPLTLEVLNHWGFYHTGDVGNVVFAMVEKGVLQAGKEDFRKDFNDFYDFRSTFLKPFTEANTSSPESSEKIMPVI